MQERTLASDYGLLEEAMRAAEAAGRHRPARPKPFPELPQYIKALVGQARSCALCLLDCSPACARFASFRRPGRVHFAAKTAPKVHSEVPSACTAASL